MSETLVLLHGFGGTHRTWDAVRGQLPAERYRAVIAPDLPGHGTGAAQRPITFDTAVATVLDALPTAPVTLAGYSLGGRIAQHVILAHPERVDRLVLVATTPGLDDPGERAARAQADAKLAAQIESMSATQFADRWQALPLFAGTAPDAARLWRADLLRNDPRDLATAMLGLSTGVMEPLWSRLGEVTVPVTVVVGVRDVKFRAIAAEMMERLEDGELVVVDDAGHGLPREAPAALAAAIARR